MKCKKCKECNIVFGQDVKHYAKGMCRSCYNKEHYKTHKRQLQEYYLRPEVKKHRKEWRKDYYNIPEVKIRYNKQNNCNKHIRLHYNRYLELIEFEQMRSLTTLEQLRMGTYKIMLEEVE